MRATRWSLFAVIYLMTTLQPPYADGRKFGSCPTLPTRPLDTAVDKCRADEECDGRNICCRTLIGRTCMKPVEMRASRRRGFCPPYFGEKKIDARDFCDRDDDCPEDRLCCDTIAGNTCMKPEIRISPRYKVLCPDLNGPVEENAVDRCQSDDQCSGGTICCETIMGTACMEPKAIKAKTTSGKCPRVSSKLLNNAKDRCAEDDDCDDHWKCCQTITGKMCLKPKD